MAEASTLVATATQLPLNDRVAIVTGGSRGIGRDISLHLASLGAKVVINYASNQSEADLVASQINATSPSKSPRAITAKANISDPDQVKSLFDVAESSFATQVHILVNSAGISDSKHPKLSETSIEDFDRILSVNTRGAFLCCKEAANRLKQGGGGRIICLTSSLVASLKPGFTAYVASKAAVESMVKVFAKELKGTGITANCVAPGPIATDLFFDGKTEEMVQMAVDQCPLGRLGQTDDVAPVVGFLATDAGLWVNGQVVRVNGGYV